MAIETESTERCAAVVGELLDAVRRTIHDRNVTYAEFELAKRFVIELGETGEWPLFADVFFETTVERLAAEEQGLEGTTIEGPYYIAGAPLIDPPYALPMRPGEKGDGLMFKGTVRDSEGRPVPGALLDTWQADAEAKYSCIHEGVPAFNLRGRFHADDNGEFALRTVVPAPYEIPKSGPTGRLVDAAGWHAWRPAHLHWKVSADGYRPITTQLYFKDADWLDSDVASAVKPELIIPLHRQDGAEPRYETSYTFRLSRG
jgi:catechol 1,2-dioxygenase